jgi:AraC family transcriptional regulator, transcriptional activator FtrA
MPRGSSQRATVEVAVLVDEGSNPFEFGCVCEIFGARRTAELGFEPYSLRVVSPQRRVAMRDGLFSLGAVGGLADLDGAHTVVVPNRPDVDTPGRPAVLAAIRRAHERGARLVGLCTGAFTLAEAGLLDGRAAAVHWQLADEFARRFPRVRVEPDVLFVDDGDVVTSAGSAAALDLGLHLVRGDHGAEIANLVSRRLVFAAFRDGGQRQFVERPVPPAGQASLAPTLAWARSRLARPLTVADLARHAGWAPRTLARHFVAETGMAPQRWLAAARIRAARRLLEGTDLPVEVIAARCGLGTAANLRVHLARDAGVTPTAYRAAYRGHRLEAGS